MMDYRTRIHRPRAYNLPGHAHELTFTCYQRFAFFSKERCCEWLAESIQHARLKLGFQLWAYVFMPDHVHLVVYSPNIDYDDSRFIKRIKEPVGRKAIGYLRQEAPDWLERIRVRHGSRVNYRFWQIGRGYDRNIDRTSTLVAAIDYLHLNPVRKGLVARARDWKWASAGWFEQCGLNELKPDPIPAAWLEIAS